MATYGVLVSYSYMDAIKHTCGVQSEVMSLDFLPNSPSGLKKIAEAIGKKRPYQQDIYILNLLPLTNDPKPKDIDDDWE